MSDEQFDSLVKRLETVAEREPLGYKARVLGLALLGYVYLFVILGGIFGLGLGSVWLFKGGHGTTLLLLKKLLVPLAVLGFVVIRAMWVRIAPPEGIHLRRNQFPALFQVLDAMRARLKGPKIHAVLLSDNFNASVSQVPRLGIFGWPKNYLVLGLPLMQAVSPQELQAILGHEYGHLSGAHGKFSAWIYRIRMTWYKLMEAFDQEDRWGKGIFQKFFDWYAPYFGAYSFVLARANEYEADRCSADLTNPRLAADALTAVYVKGETLQKGFWPTVYDRADQLPTPVPSMYLEMGQFLRAPSPSMPLENILEQVMREETGSADTHPALQDRLAALQQEARIPESLATTAAVEFLGRQYEDLVQRFSQTWSFQVEEGWAERHESVKTGKAQLEQLARRSQEADFTDEEAYEYAKLSEEFGTKEEAIDRYRAVLTMNATHVSALFALGRLLLRQNDEEGIDCVEQALTLDPGATLDGCREIYHFLRDRGRSEEAEQYRERFDERAEFEDRVEEERGQLSLDDTYVPHELPPETVAALVDHLQGYKAIARAYLVKKCTTLSDEPLYVCGVKGMPTWYWFSKDGACTQLVNSLVRESTFPGEIFYLVLDEQNPRFLKMFAEVSGALIYRKGEARKESWGDKKVLHQPEAI